MQERMAKSPKGDVYWQEAIQFLNDKLSKEEMTRWFSNIKYISFNNGTLTISTDSSFMQDQIKRRYGKLLQKFLEQVSGRELALKIIVKESGHSAVAQGDDPIVPQSKNRSPSSGRQVTLLRRYTFENFVIGDGNAFAANASIAISRSPGTNYNPCLIYGGVGLGKTHLIQAIGNWIINNNQHVKVLYVTSENFINEFIQSIREKRTTRFKNRYRNADVLLLDDIQFLQKKIETQEELFHTFNALYDANKQMVFTCDRHVREIREITDRLRNRFERGLNIDLQPPSYETRVAILRKKTVEMRATDIFSDESILYLIAEQITTNVRDLESALIKLAAYAKLVEKTITIEVIKEQLSSVPSKNIQTGVHEILKVISEYFNISIADMKGTSRKKSVIFPRHIAMYIVREITELSTTEIGLEFGGKDHTTVMNACQKIKNMLLADSTLESTINALIRSVNSL